MATPPNTWVYNNTTTASAVTPSWTQLYFNSGTIGTYFSGSGSSVYANTATGSSYQGSQEQYSADYMIRQLESVGHVVLQKKHHAVMRGAPLWDTDRYDPVTGHTAAIHYGYALPEKEGNYLMPDGSTLKVDNYGNYQVLDQDAKVTYKANRIREFNPYLNASDLLEKFIGYVGGLGLDVRQNEILRLPIEAFINWLILQAATKDGDSLEGLPSVERALPAPVPKRPRCLGCGRYMSKMWAATTRMAFCSQEHWSKHVRNGTPLLRSP